MGIWGKNVPGSGKTQGRGLEEEISLECLRGSRRPVWLEQSERGGH